MQRAHHRTETRLERYQTKQKQAVNLPLSIATINFLHDENVAFILRSAACFGVRNLYVIGNVPPHKVLYPKSGSLVDFVNIKTFRNPHEFLEFAHNEKIHLLSAELDQEAKNVHEYSFDFSKNLTMVFGHEMTGIPVEILLRSEKIFIPMNGSGYSLNVSQSATVMMYEAAKQFLVR